MMARSFPERIARRVTACWRRKLTLTALLGAGFWAGYSLLGRHAFFPLREIPRLWPDHAVPYQPVPWGWIYLSPFLVSSILPWLLPSADALRRYAAGFLYLVLPSFLIFLVFPVAAPRPDAPVTDAAMRIIRGYDGPLNCFPSLHAGFLVFHLALAWRMCGRRAPLPVVIAALAWGAAVLVSTLATRQHYTLDLVAGAALGALADRLAWRTLACEAAAAVKIPASNGSIPHAGAR